MLPLPPLNGEIRKYSNSIHPAHDRTCYFHAPDLEKSAQWYGAFLGMKFYIYTYKNINSHNNFDATKRNDEVSRDPWAKPHTVSFRGTGSPTSQWGVELSKRDPLLTDNREWRVQALIDLYDLIGRMQAIGVEPSEKPSIQEMIDDYPRGWRKYAEQPRMAHHVGRRPHHSTACAFEDPAGNILIVRLEVQEPLPGFGMYWR